MSRKSSPTKRRIKKLSTVELRDLTRHATQRADRAVGDACQLIDDNRTQYMLVINVIGNLILRAASMLGQTISNEEIAFTVKSLADWLDRAE